MPTNALRRNGFRLARISAAAVLLAGAAACGGTAQAGTNSSASVTYAFTVKDGKRTAGTDSCTAKLNQKVTIKVLTDVDGEVHVHGYDKESEVTAGKPAQVSFTANLPGIFDVELHDSDLKLCELRVQ